MGFIPHESKMRPPTLALPVLDLEAPSNNKQGLFKFSNHALKSSILILIFLFLVLTTNLLIVDLLMFVFHCFLIANYNQVLSSCCICLTPIALAPLELLNLVVMLQVLARIVLLLGV